METDRLWGTPHCRISGTHFGCQIAAIACGPNQLGAMPILDDAQIDVDTITYCVGVRADLVRLGNESLGLRPVETRKRNCERDGQTKSALRSWANSDGCRDRSILRHLWSTSRGHKLHRANEASSVASREQLFQIVSLTANPAQLLWP